MFSNVHFCFALEVFVIEFFLFNVTNVCVWRIGNILKANKATKISDRVFAITLVINS